MTLAKLLTRLHGAWLVMTGRVELPNVPLEEMEIAMAFEQTKAQIARLEGAVQRASDGKAADAAAVKTAQDAEAVAEQNLADADTEIAGLLGPVADSAEAAFPAPPPPAQ